jgi:outer membrane protein OmpA-like peptidoglycan-associated protein
VPTLQRRLLATGAIEHFSKMVQPAIGHELQQHPSKTDPAICQISDGGKLASPATSPSLEAMLLTIIEHATQHAEVHFGRGQPGVSLGGFPDPTKPKVQKIDLDDIWRLERGAPGHGLAALAHEIKENWTAHDPTRPGTHEDAHPSGITAGDDVIQDLIDPDASRVAERKVPGPPDDIRVIDYKTYYLVFAHHWKGTNRKLVRPRTTERKRISQHPIEEFATGSDAPPPTAAAAISAASADLLAHPRATAHVEGFTDSSGPQATNKVLSQRRADAIAKQLANDPVQGGWLYAVGRGETEDFDDQARNRRVTVTIDEPAPKAA